MASLPPAPIEEPTDPAVDNPVHAPGDPDPAPPIEPAMPPPD
jgi:hypothetical protein